MTMHFNARNYRDASEPIALDDALARFPTLAATGPHVSRSPKYSFISTATVLQNLTAEGFTIHGVKTARTRRNGPNPKYGFERHNVTLRHPAFPALSKVGDVIPQINLLGSHDGSSALEFMEGFFRLWCLNGAVTQINGARFRIRHVGDVSADVITAAHSAAQRLNLLAGKIETWRGVTLSDDAADAFATEALALRYDDGASPVSPQALLGVRRTEDASNDAWTVYNRVQENLLRGGMVGVTVGASGKPRRASVRAVASVNRDVEINTALFALADKYALAA